jgi:threonine synthase
MARRFNPATAAYDHQLSAGFLNPEDRVVLFNTGSGLKYTDAIAEAMHLQRPGAKKYPATDPGRRHHHPTVRSMIRSPSARPTPVTGDSSRARNIYEWNRVLLSGTNPA